MLLYCGVGMGRPMKISDYAYSEIDKFKVENKIENWKDALDACLKAMLATKETLAAESPEELQKRLLVATVEIKESTAASAKLEREHKEIRMSKDRQQIEINALKILQMQKGIEQRLTGIVAQSMPNGVRISTPTIESKSKLPPGYFRCQCGSVFHLKNGQKVNGDDSNHICKFSGGDKIDATGMPPIWCNVEGCQRIWRFEDYEKRNQTKQAMQFEIMQHYKNVHNQDMPEESDPFMVKA